jgi:peptidyl-prolyl cis-trans isomerase D
MKGELREVRNEVSMAKNKSQKVLTKKHLARQEREHRQTMLISGIAIAIIAIVVLGIAYGLLNTKLFLNWRTAVTVNGEKRTLHEFQARARVTRQQLIGQYMQYTQMAQMFGMDPNSDPQLSQALSQILSELDTPSTLGGQVIDDMVNDLLIRQYASANGITVSAADVEKAAQEALRYYQNGTPTPTLTPTELFFPTLNATQLALITSTPTPTSASTETLVSTLTPRPTATPDLTSTATPIPSATPTATAYTLKGYQGQYKDTLKTYSALGLSDADFRYIFFESGLYHDRVLAKVTADISHQQEQVWARHILVTDETIAKDIRVQLSAGVDFATLAAKYSIDTGSKDKGGDLGWFGHGAMIAEFENAAFSLKIGEISQPIKTTYGYHIIQVIGHELRPLTEQEYQTAVTSAFTAWLDKQRAASKIDINKGWPDFVPTTPTLAQAMAKDAATSTAYVATYQAQNGTK